MGLHWLPVLPITFLPPYPRRSRSLLLAEKDNVCECVCERECQGRRVNYPRGSDSPARTLGRADALFRVSTIRKCSTEPPCLLSISSSSLFIWSPRSLLSLRAPEGEQTPFRNMLATKSRLNPNN